MSFSFALGDLMLFRYRYLLAFGSNKGDNEQNLRKGLDALLLHSTKLVRTSEWRVTAPLPSEKYETAGQDFYLNFVAEVNSSLPPMSFLRVIHQIEDSIGHPRDRKWAPRELDIDILFCGIGLENDGFAKCAAYKIEEKSFAPGMEAFSIPHKGFWERDFLLEMVLKDLGISAEVLKKHSRG